MDCPHKVGKYYVGRMEFDTFKEQFPCHGLYDYHSVSFELDDSGDLVDINLYDEQGKVRDLDELDHSAEHALNCLIDDAKEEVAKRTPLQDLLGVVGEFNRAMEGEA